MAKLADLIWKNAELLRGAYKEPEYRKIILPFTVLRRLDCVLEATKAQVLTQWDDLAGKDYSPEMTDRFLCKASGYSFYNTSRFTLAMLLDDPNGLRDNLEHYLNGFSTNVRDIFEKFGFVPVVDKLLEKKRLYLVLQRFVETDLHPETVSNLDMGQAFEELLRRFNDVSPAGEQYTPRDAIKLMVNILLDPDDEALSVPGTVRTFYDPTAGTGGILSVGEEHIRELNDRASVKLFGQEFEDETYAICKADMLIRGQDPANIALGDTLEHDHHEGKRFDYIGANPPYGVEWKPAKDAVEAEHKKKGFGGRFGPGLPRISDGQMLFTLHMLSKMQPVVDGKGGSRISVVHNGSPLFTGDAGSGESEIRRWILDHDYLEAIVALPTDMFYNTNIATYLWFLTNRKDPDRRGKVQLIDATGMSQLMKKNLGKKRRELTEDCIARITQAYHDFKDLDWQEKDAQGKPGRALKAKVLPAEHFFYRRVTIERPLRLRFEVAEILPNLDDKARQKQFGEDGGELVAALTRLKEQDPAQVWTDADSFRAALQAADDANAKAAGLKHRKLKAKQFEAARKGQGIKDKSAEPCTDEKGKVLPDVALRDAEYVPFGSDIAQYFQDEVIPHWPDAWIDEETKDAKDGLVGIVGTEINFNREFYVYTPPRSRETILADIEGMEQTFLELLHGVKA